MQRLRSERSAEREVIRRIFYFCVCVCAVSERKGKRRRLWRSVKPSLLTAATASLVLASILGFGPLGYLKSNWANCASTN